MEGDGIYRPGGDLAGAIRLAHGDGRKGVVMSVTVKLKGHLRA